jgi:hypothetical protein
MDNCNLPFDWKIHDPLRKQAGIQVRFGYDFKCPLDGHLAVIGFGRVEPIESKPEATLSNDK